MRCSIVFDDAEMKADVDSELLSITDAFLACRRQLHVANISYIAELAHTTKEEVALDIPVVWLIKGSSVELPWGNCVYVE